MTTLPGNHFAEHAENASGQNATSLEADAILALAFEQRTANLIGMLQLQIGLSESASGVSERAANELNARLGLDDA